MTSATRRRIDHILVEMGLAETRQKAQALILAGTVFSNGEKVKKAGQVVTYNDSLVVKSREHPYVSRGGLKLEGALKEFKINPEGFEILDVGASTGGFTDCLLQNGASCVYAIDVGYGQLAWKLRGDSRVILLERTNIKHLSFDKIRCKLDLAVIDTSFISLRLIIPKVIQFLKEEGQILALVKPQFEAGYEEVGRRGLVKNEEVHRKIIRKLRETAKNHFLSVIGETESKIRGKKSGNREYFMYFKKNH